MFPKYRPDILYSFYKEIFIDYYYLGQIIGFVILDKSSGIIISGSF